MVNTANKPLNDVQLMLLKLFSRDMSAKEISEIRDLLLNYLDEKLQNQLDLDIERKNISQSDIDKKLNESQRTKQ